MQTQNNLPVELAPCSVYCISFPCQLINKKLIHTHFGENRFQFRNVIPEVFRKHRTMGFDVNHAFQEKRWKRNSAGGTIHFYHYTSKN